MMRLLVCAFLLLFGFASAAGAREVDDHRDAYRRLLDRHGPAVVRLKFVISLNVGGNENRQEGEASATIVSPDGLVLVADGLLNPKTALSGTLPPGMTIPEPKVDELRVRMAASDKDLVAVPVTRDPDLGIAWLQIVDAPRDLPHVDLSKQAEPQVGQTYYVVARVSEDYGSVAVVAHGFLLGETDTPTRAFLSTGPLDLAFDAEGRALGFVTRHRTRDLRYYAQFGGLMPQQMIAARRVARATAQAHAIAAKRPKPAVDL